LAEPLHINLNSEIHNHEKNSNTLFKPGIDRDINYRLRNELPTHFNFSSYEFTDLDENGGSWQPILFSSATDIVIDAPAAVNSAEYLAELAELKAAAQNVTGGQADAVEYWTNNPVTSWNEIALDLAAKYNLIPPPNPDGTYTLPTPANPQGPPPFPFAHPPYTSRMLAYLSVAQFDGLIAAWHYKYEYNRPATYVTDRYYSVCIF
jgi:hypothetical protein